MIKTIYKMFPVWAFDKEEEWLNKMSAIGLQLCDVGFCRYVFEEGTPGEYIYRLELLENLPVHSESTQYIRFIEDTGAEHIGSLMRWGYFRKKADGHGFDLFSDIASRIKHLNRMLALMGILFSAALLNGAVQLSSWFSHNMRESLIASILCLVLFSIAGYGFIRISLKKQKLKREKILHE